MSHPMLRAALLVSLIGAFTGSLRAQGQAWTRLPVGPPAVEAPVGLCPGDPALMYVGTFGGGVLTSRDEGHTFQAANHGLTNLAVAAMAVNPVHCETAYVATFGSGVFKTEDAGRSWTSLGEASAPIVWLAIDPRRPWILYSGLNGGSGVRKTTDGGTTWQDAGSGLPSTSVWAIQVDPVDTDVLYAGTGGAGGFKSVDGGRSWQPLDIAPIVWSFAIDPRDHRTVYAGTNGGGVYRSTDGGATFGQAGVPGSGRVLSLALDPHRRGVVYAALSGGGVWVSQDFGSRFSATAFDRGLAIVLSVRPSGEVFVGTGADGVYASGSYGSVWSPVARDELGALWSQNVYAIAVDPRRPARVVASTNDGGVLISNDGGHAWATLGAGFSSRAGRAIAFDPADPDRLYVGSFNGGGLQVSNDGGRSWTPRAFGSPAVYVWSVAVDADTRAVYAGTVGEGLWRSTDLGATFTRMAASVVSDVRAIAVDGTRVLVGGRQGLHRSTDGGLTWTQVHATFVSGVTIDPANPGLVYVNTQTGGVLRSRDGGATFAAINNGLTTLRTSRGASVAIDPRRPDTLYVATEGGGIFRSVDGGESWSAVNQGLENLTVFALAMDPQAPDVLYAGGGSGIFKTTTGAVAR